MRKYLIALLFVFFSAFSFAFSQQDLVSLLQKPHNIQGDFIQQRYLKSLIKPITATGKFVLLPNQGLLWQMQKPFVNNLRVKPDGITQWNGSHWLSNDQLGQSKQIHLFLGLFSGDISSLATQFNLLLTGSEQDWTLRLDPSSLLMKQIFTQINVRGGSFVKEIELLEKQGDRTVIQFSDVKTDSEMDAFAASALK
ncbi:MAG TPA: outer membrane lipoprotein carrier protein LolA [Pasteurellaceae bacterium]|nr:outer membrane lipoprotein carrier protein LolA [Pasteurellaceae bacterium]